MSLDAMQHLLISRKLVGLIQDAKRRYVMNLTGCVQMDKRIWQDIVETTKQLDELDKLAHDASTSTGTIANANRGADGVDAAPQMADVGTALAEPDDGADSHDVGLRTVEPEPDDEKREHVPAGGQGSSPAGPALYPGGELEASWDLCFLQFSNRWELHDEAGDDGTLLATGMLDEVLAVAERYMGGTPSLPSAGAAE